MQGSVADLGRGSHYEDAGRVVTVAVRQASVRGVSHQHPAVLASDTDNEFSRGDDLLDCQTAAAQGAELPSLEPSKVESWNKLRRIFGDCEFRLGFDDRFFEPSNRILVRFVGSFRRCKFASENCQLRFEVPNGGLSSGLRPGPVDEWLLRSICAAATSNTRAIRPMRYSDPGGL